MTVGGAAIGTFGVPATAATRCLAAAKAGAAPRAATARRLTTTETPGAP